jgi:GTP-binding protein Era
MVFMDTPGIHQTKTALHQSMVRSACAAFQEVDIILLMIEMSRAELPEVSSVIEHLKRVRKPAILVVNKIDKGPKKQLLPIIAEYQKLYPFDAIVPVSGLTGDGVDSLLGDLRTRLKPGPQFFPNDMSTDQGEHFTVAEIIREQVYRHASKEIPYSTAVHVDGLEEIPGKQILSVVARIYVEKLSQKKILVGQEGRMIKLIGRSARLELERRFGIQVYLELKVTVVKNWSRDAKALRRMGY